MIIMVSIAIAGPSGAGKSSLAKALAKDLGYVYVDTGAMYRSIGCTPSVRALTRMTPTLSPHCCRRSSSASA